jgi:hypothetical protein
MTSLGGTCPYLRLSILFTWQDLQDLTYLWIVLQYLSSTSWISLSLQDESDQGAGGSGGTKQQLCVIEMQE